MASKIPFSSEASNSAEASGETPVLEKEFSGTKDAVIDDHSLTSRQRQRAELDDQVADYLAQGGEIDHVQAHVTADPPQKTGSRYGSRPI